MNLTLLIDLDDTLLPNSTEKFLPPYLKALSNHLDFLGTSQVVQETLFYATGQAMDNHDPTVTIKQSFDDHFYPALGTTQIQLQDILLDFYTNKFPTLSPISSPSPETVQFVDQCLERGYQIAIATNPIFPKIATYERLRWAGLPPEEYPFAVISTYEDFHFSKPHPAYFMEIMAQIGWPDNQVVVVGNDLHYDIQPAKQVGLATYWMIDDLSQKSCALTHGAGPLVDFQDWLNLQTEDSLTPDLGGLKSSIEILRTTPSALLTFLTKLPREHWSRKPDPNDWSITEILCHLRDVDKEVHIPRIELLRDSPSPFLTAIDADAWAEQRSYHLQDGKQALSSFNLARNRLIELIDNLPDTVEQKDVRHTIFGPTNLTEILKIAARHDRLHIQQLYSLIPKA